MTGGCVFIAQILWLLNTTRAFQHLFPAEMSREVARHVEYAKYETLCTTVKLKYI